MRALFVVLLHPNIEITLQLVDVLQIFLQNVTRSNSSSKMEAFEDAVGLPWS
jgi:hypothetical protein